MRDSAGKVTLGRLALDTLRERRLAARLTQDELARALGTTQQTVARWEAGKAEPNVATLRELAMIFATTVDALVGGAPPSTRHSPTTYGLLSGGAQEPLWGHAGVLLPGHAKSRWFPINELHARRIARLLDAGQAGWLTFASLDNRLVAVKVANVTKVCLLEREADRPRADWDVRWGEDAGIPLDFYRVLDGHLVADAEPDASIPSTLVAVVREAVATQGWDRETLVRMTRDATLWLADGTTPGPASMAPVHLWELLVGIEHGTAPRVLRIDDEGRHYYPAERVALLQMPLLHVLAAGESDLDADDDSVFDDDVSGRS